MGGLIAEQPLGLVDGEQRFVLADSVADLDAGKELLDHSSIRSRQHRVRISNDEDLGPRQVRLQRPTNGLCAVPRIDIAPRFHFREPGSSSKEGKRA